MASYKAQTGLLGNKKALEKCLLLLFALDRSLMRKRHATAKHRKSLLTFLVI